MKKIRAIAFTVIGAISVLCKFTQGSYNSNYAFSDIVSSLGNILLVAGLVLITMGVTQLMEMKDKEKEEIYNHFQSEEA